MVGGSNKMREFRGHIYYPWFKEWLDMVCVLNHVRDSTGRSALRWNMATEALAVHAPSVDK